MKKHFVHQDIVRDTHNTHTTSTPHTNTLIYIRLWVIDNNERINCVLKAAKSA